MTIDLRKRIEEARKRLEVAHMAFVRTLTTSS